MTPVPQPTATALLPVAARYAAWLGMSEQEVLADRDEAAQDVRALQLVLHLERDAVVSRHRALELAAGGAALLCLDPRSEPDGDWFEAVRLYCVGHIRKVTRRARGAQWEATADLPGLTLTAPDADGVVGGTQVRALLPGPVATLDKRVAKLQVGGTDVPWDPAAVPADARSSGPVLQLWVHDEPPMTAGKQMAQTGHAGMIAAALLAADGDPMLGAWAAAGCPVTVARASSAEWSALVIALEDPAAAWRSDRLLAVRDAGFTEIPAGTVTVIARAPR
ncbi:MAG: peptidyl-tRNA hydrolase [Nakamurella sp.]